MDAESLFSGASTWQFTLTCRALRLTLRAHPPLGSTPAHLSGACSETLGLFFRGSVPQQIAEIARHLCQRQHTKRRDLHITPDGMYLRSLWPPSVNHLPR